jgi:hypothetical protein
MYGAILTMIAGHHVTDVLQASRGVHVSDSTTLALTISSTPFADYGIPNILAHHPGATSVTARAIRHKNVNVTAGPLVEF